MTETNAELQPTMPRRDEHDVRTVPPFASEAKVELPVESHDGEDLTSPGANVMPGVRMMLFSGNGW